MQCSPQLFSLPGRTSFSSTTAPWLAHVGALGQKWAVGPHWILCNFSCYLGQVSLQQSFPTSIKPLTWLNKSSIKKEIKGNFHNLNGTHTEMGGTQGSLVVWGPGTAAHFCTVDNPDLCVDVITYSYIMSPCWSTTLVQAEISHQRGMFHRLPTNSMHTFTVPRGWTRLTGHRRQTKVLRCPLPNNACLSCTLS